jgi:hypothetical protein
MPETHSEKNKPYVKNSNPLIYLKKKNVYFLTIDVVVSYANICLAH